MKALIIQHARNEGPGMLLDALKGHGWEHQVIMMERHRTGLAAKLDNYDALIILGGSMSACEEDRYPYLKTVQDMIRQARDQALPTLGICLGAQLMARALGAHVGPNPVKEIGWYPIELTPEGLQNPLFKDLPEGFAVFQWHGDTFAVPPGAVLLARGKTCLNQAFELNGCMWGLQFHPEITPRIINEWSECWADELIDFRGSTAVRIIHEKTRIYWEEERRHREILLDNIMGLLAQRNCQAV